jgi:hypothetical protein
MVGSAERSEARSPGHMADKIAVVKLNFTITQISKTLRVVRWIFVGYLYLELDIKMLEWIYIPKNIQKTLGGLNLFCFSLGY